MFQNYHKRCCKTSPTDSYGEEEESPLEELPIRVEKPPVKRKPQPLKPSVPPANLPLLPVKPPSPQKQQVPSVVHPPTAQDIKSTVCIIQHFGGNPLSCFPNCQPSNPPLCPPVHSSCAPPIVKSFVPKLEPRSSTEIEIDMGQDVGSCCAKYILCLFNFIFFVSIKDSIWIRLKVNNSLFIF